MAREETEKPWDGELTVDSEAWIPYPYDKGWEITCCDCGLVHDVSFKKVNGVHFAKFERNDELTERTRNGTWPDQERIDRTLSERKEMERRANGHPQGKSNQI